MNAGEKRAALSGAVRCGELVVAPGVFEMISAKIADGMGFGALYMTGYGVAASHLGVPDAGLASYGDVVERVRVIANGTDTPLICDADTGFGGLLNVRHTVRGFEQAGCAAVQIEDQVAPKKCGYTPDRRVIPAEEMVTKIRVALEAREDPNLLIIARTDARTELSLEQALDRGKAYARAGADVVFVQAPECAEELKRIGQEIDSPLAANMGDGRTEPALSPAELSELGFELVIYPGLGMLACAAALEASYGALREGAIPAGLAASLYARDQMHRLMGFEDVWAFESRWLDAD